MLSMKYFSEFCEMKLKDIAGKITLFLYYTNTEG